MHRRIQALAAAAVVAFGVGLILGAAHESTAEKNAKAFAKAWRRGDTAGMYRRLSDDARRHFSLTAFRAAYARDAMTATARSLDVGDAKDRGNHTYDIPVRAATRIFGEVDGKVTLKASDSGVDWQPYMAF